MPKKEKIANTFVSAILNSNGANGGNWTRDGGATLAFCLFCPCEGKSRAYARLLLFPITPVWWGPRVFVIRTSAAGLSNKKRFPIWEPFFFGANGGNWTRDLVLTKDALYRLSHVSIYSVFSLSPHLQRKRFSCWAITVHSVECLIIILG